MAHHLHVIKVLHNVIVGFYLSWGGAVIGDLKVGRVIDGTLIVGQSLAYASALSLYGYVHAYMC